MTQIADIEAFLVAARAGSFAAAGRELGTAAPVLTKRVDRLEDRVGARLFARTTRRLTLTPEGERMRPRLQAVMVEYEQALRDALPAAGGLRGHLRVKSPTTVGTVVGESLTRFSAANPGLTFELLLIDRAVNPLEESFEVAVGAFPMSFASVVDVPLCPYERVLVAAPGYLAGRPALRHPTELVQHDSLVFLPAGDTWSFETERGSIATEVRGRFAANDSRILLAAALRGLGVAVLPRFLAREALETGLLVHLLDEFPITPLWFKAMVPQNRVHHTEVAALVDHLRADFGPVPPWDRPPDQPVTNA
ncbi:MAG TPA: LysR family transcriptional regulator [Amaricoccus sp.]|nr:LysR family transcriptional regulator [Amaricoccus sp.]